MDWRIRLDTLISKELRKRGIGKQAFSEQLGFNKLYLNQILRPGSNPGMQNIQKICDAVGVKLSDLYSEAPLTDSARGVVDLLPDLTQKDIKELKEFIASLDEQDALSHK